MGYPLERKPRKDSQYETFTRFIFPILDGRTDRPSDRCKYFAFKSRQDVQNFWSDPTLRSRLELVCNTINQHKNKNIGIKTILGGGEMGQTDSFKLHVCVTLFAQLTGACK